MNGKFTHSNPSAFIPNFPITKHWRNFYSANIHWTLNKTRPAKTCSTLPFEFVICKPKNSQPTQESGWFAKNRRLKRHGAFRLTKYFCRHFVPEEFIWVSNKWPVGGRGWPGGGGVVIFQRRPPPPCILAISMIRPISPEPPVQVLRPRGAPFASTLPRLGYVSTCCSAHFDTYILN